MNIISTLSAELGIRQSQIEKTVALIDDGNTIPFIARYRKEVTGSLDDTVLRRLYDRLTYLRSFEQRKGEISALIDGQGKLTPEITSALEAASTLTELEDIYRPYKGHRRTRASVARERGLEPLAELVKIDPRSIGVGQYQHDMKQSRLGEALSGVVEYCVNHVGVDINTASYSLLSHVAGINAASAKNIVKYREENGAFTSRAQIKKVPRIGARAFEQCAGFLRVSGGREILDETGVHPESYAAARALLDRFSLHEEDVRRGNVIGLDKAVREAGEAQIADELGVGIPTLRDIVAELSKPGRDARDELPAPILRTDVLTLEDLCEGMELTGTVRNVVDFGAFVDIGVHQDGLVHISQISKKRIAHPSEVLAIGDIVKVKIISLDRAKGRIGLTMKF